MQAMAEYTAALQAGGRLDSCNQDRGGGGMKAGVFETGMSDTAISAEMPSYTTHGIGINVSRPDRPLWPKIAFNAINLFDKVAAAYTFQGGLRISSIMWPSHRRL